MNGDDHFLAEHNPKANIHMMYLHFVGCIDTLRSDRDGLRPEARVIARGSEGERKANTMRLEKLMKKWLICFEI